MARQSTGAQYVCGNASLIRIKLGTDVSNLTMSPNDLSCASTRPEYAGRVRRADISAEFIHYDSFCNALLTMPASLGGTSVNGGGSRVNTAAMTSLTVPAANGDTPESISYRTAPKLKMSVW